MIKFLAALLIVCAISATAFTQRVSTGTQAQVPPASERMLPALGNNIPSADRPPYSHSVTGKLLLTNSADHSMVIKVDNAPPMKIIIDDKTRKTADKNTEFEGKKLSFDDYAAGRTVKVTLRISDNRVLELRLKPTPK